MVSASPHTRKSNGPMGAGEQAESIKSIVHTRLLETLDLAEARRMPVEQLHTECSRRVDVLLSEQRWPLSAPEKRQLLRDLMDEIFGLGPLEELLRDHTISDILVNGPRQVYIERRGRLESTNASFRDDMHLMQIIQRIATRVGRRIDEGSPMLDARLMDGSRVNAIIPPLALDGPALSVRRFGAEPMNIERLIQLKTIPSEVAVFLEACVRCKTNILISGGTGSGKTTLLNVLSRWIPAGERVVTIEDAAELKLQRDHVVRLETRQTNIEGKGEVSQRELLRNSLRMRPDRIIIGEVRGAEALDMLQAMNTGHEGSMGTIHANTTRDALRRVENMVSMTGLNLPVNVIRQQITSSVHILVHLARLTGGVRRLMAVSEITGMEGDVICLHDVFAYRQSGLDANGRAQGRFESLGVRPRLLKRLHTEGVKLPEQLFEQKPLSPIV